MLNRRIVMARGKYLSLEEARKKGALEQFAREHPIKDVHPHARSRFNRLLEAAATGVASGDVRAQVHTGQP